MQCLVTAISVEQRTARPQQSVRQGEADSALMLTLGRSTKAHAAAEGHQTTNRGARYGCQVGVANQAPVGGRSGIATSHCALRDLAEQSLGCRSRSSVHSQGLNALGGHLWAGTAQDDLDELGPYVARLGVQVRALGFGQRLHLHPASRTVGDASGTNHCSCECAKLARRLQRQQRGTAEQPAVSGIRTTCAARTTLRGSRRGAATAEAIASLGA